MLHCDIQQLQNPKGELLSRLASQLKQNHVWTPISTGKGGRGSPVSFNQDLKTGRPLIKALLCTFILFLSRLCWLVSPALILRFWSMVSDISLLPIAPWSSCDVKKETSKSPWPHLSLLNYWIEALGSWMFLFSTSHPQCMRVCGILYLPCPHPHPCRNGFIHFPRTVTNITSWLKELWQGTAPKCARATLFDLDVFLMMKSNTAAGLLADVIPECFGIMLIGAELGFNVSITNQSTPGKNLYLDGWTVIIIIDIQTDLFLLDT